MCCNTYYKIKNSSPKPVPAAWPRTGIGCRLQVPGRGNQQQPILQRPHSEYNYLGKSVPWLPQEKHKVQKSRIKGNGIQNSCSSISGVFIISLSPYTKSNIARLEMVQRRAARWTLSEYSPYASVTQMLQSLGWRSLEQRRSDSRLCLFYKIVYGLVAIDMPPYVVHPLRTPRNSHTLCFRQIQSTVDYYKYSFYPLSNVQWNRLPAHIAILPTFDSFKRAVCTVSHPMP